ncbi:Aldo/keto reductase [Lindgomyces ingoldianus]|uniref:Aldo/keto reductase n=1 Tax=Lindgomyces ingoldianus TaxID=673940 RepID=A0ACB6Q8A4_9PLEO|nr:Aldo/keto reductase [Lindgomyces ingoldianus]KAF2463198.1 Aldo/keto reductase [Lindgomyces ingoldianus]
MVKLVGKEVGTIGYGLMGLTWRAKPPSQEQSFKAMRTALASGANAWNGGEIYGSLERNSLHLLNEYFTKYPEDAEKVVLSIKGGVVPGTMNTDGSKAGVQRSIDECLKVLDGKKFLDLFECARVDKKVPIEDTVSYIAEYVKAGKVGGISLSEVNANTIRRAAKVHKIAAVEVEFSLWATEILENGVAKACAELDIPIIAYSPLGRGFLTGQYKSYDDLPADSHLKIFPRFQPDVFDENLKLVKEVDKVASKKGCSPAQIAMGWVLAHSKKNGLPEILPIPGATTAERIEENMKPAQLSEEDMDVMNDILKRFRPIGDRYHPAAMAAVEG